jgi:hypothetical protein
MNTRTLVIAVAIGLAAAHAASEQTAITEATLAMSTGTISDATATVETGPGDPLTGTEERRPGVEHANAELGAGHRRSPGGRYAGTQNAAPNRQP